MPVTKSAMNHLLESALPFTRLQNETCVSCGLGERSESSAGEAAVQYYSGQTDVMPDACGSYRIYSNKSRPHLGQTSLSLHRGP